MQRTYWNPTFRLAIFFLTTTLAVGGISAQTNRPSSLSFGRVSPEESVEQTVVFRNSSDAILEVEKIELTPPLIAEEITSLVLPGMNGSFKLILGHDRAPGPFEGTIAVHFKNAVQPPITIEVEGFVIPPIEFKPYPAFFVAARYGETRTASIEILNHRDSPLFLKSAESENERYTIQLETIQEGQHYRLSLTLNGKSAPGDQHDEIILHADPPLEKTLKIKVNTRIRERVYHFPDVTEMGALPLSVAMDPIMVQKLGQTLMVYRSDTDDFEVEASIDLDYIKMVVERGPLGDRYQIDLILIPEKVTPGKIEGTVTIKTNDEEFPVLEVPVTGYILD